MINELLNERLNQFEQASVELVKECWSWDQLARELWEEFEFRFVPGGDTAWMGAYIERLRRYAPGDEGVQREVAHG